MIVTPAARSAVRRAGSTLLAGALFFAGAVTLAPPPAAAEAQDIKPETTMVGSYGWDDGRPSIPSCGSSNLDGRSKGVAQWEVTSSLGIQSTIYPGYEWTVTANVWGSPRKGSPGLGNNGPDPLILQLAPNGPATPGKPTTGEIVDHGNTKYYGNGWIGPVGQSGQWGYRFDANSSPNAVEISDEVDATIQVTMRATAPGTITLPELLVSGHDSESGDFQCSMPLSYPDKWSWTVVAPQLPTSGPDVAITDSTYAAMTPDDANGGTHGVLIDVLSNDDDPDKPGGPGDPKEVRIRSWQTKSALGGTVSCGTDTQKGSEKFAEMAVGPYCSYWPPTDADAVDSFAYLLRSVSGQERQVWVTVNLRRNAPPVATESTFSAPLNTPATFNLGPKDLDGDPVTCISEVIPTNGGDVFVHADCTADWTPKPAFSGTADFVFRACDTHATLASGPMPKGVARHSDYHQGDPDDLSKTTSRRCADLPAHVEVKEAAQFKPVGVVDTDRVDAGYTGDLVGPYSVEIPVLDNDFDPNGPKPSDPNSGVEVKILEAPFMLHGSAEVTTDRRIRFTPANAYSGTVEFTYLVCEDGSKQVPPLIDNPNTPQLEGAGLCGPGKVVVDVVGNQRPTATTDEVTTASNHPVVDFAVSANDVEPDGQNLTCVAGPLKVEPQNVVASVTIDEDCTVDVTPVDGVGGVATAYYTVCDDHHLTHPKFPADPYGYDGRHPGDLAPRCHGGELRVTTVAPYVPGPSEWDLDPPPVCVDDVATTKSGQPVVIAVLANDSDLSAKGHDSPVHLTGAGFEKQEGDVDKPENATDQGGTATPGDDGQITYTPRAGFSGTDTFVYSVQDTIGHGCSGEVTVTVVGSGTDPTDINPTGIDPTGSGANNGSQPGANPTGDNPGSDSGGAQPGDGGANADGTGIDRSGHTGSGSFGQGGTPSLPRTGLELLSQVGAGLALFSAGGTIWILTRRRRCD